MSKTQTQMILCSRCGCIVRESDDICIGCGALRYATHYCGCGEAVPRKVYDALQSCLPCAVAARDELAYKFARLDANIKMLEEL